MSIVAPHFFITICAACDSSRMEVIMNDKSFVNNIKDETLVKMIDKTLLYKKTAKTRSIKSNLLKIIPAAAMIALVIGLVNLSPVISKNTYIPDNNPGVHTNPPGETIELFLPQVVEKSFFENKIVAVIKDNKASNTISAYYSLREPSAISIPEYIANGIIINFSINRSTKNQFYVLSADTSQKEKERLLKILLDHTKLNGDDIMQMYNDSGVIITETRDPYAHVRFGETRDILLLDVEWHTPETYLAEVVEIKDEIEELYSDEYIENLYENLERIREGKCYISRNINGKPNTHISLWDNKRILDIPLDSDGYYIYNVYPYYAHLYYFDEEGEYIYKIFYSNKGNYYNHISSKAEYDRILKNEIIPFCDDLLARGLITQERYDYYTTLDPLEELIDMYF